MREDLAALHPKGPATDAVVHFLAAAFLEVLTWWLESRYSLDPSDVEWLFFQMAVPAIEGDRGEAP